MTKKRYEDLRWAEAQTLTLDYEDALAWALEKEGLGESERAAFDARFPALDRELAEARQEGKLAFLELPYQVQVLPELRRLTKPLLEWCWELVVLAQGSAALGIRGLRQALCHPQHNFLPNPRRHYRPSLWVLEEGDPDRVYGLLDSLQLRRTVVNVISKSGSGAALLAQFLFIYRLLKSRVPTRARDCVIVTTDPEQGVLRRLAALEGFPSLAVPAAVPERFALLSAAGLLPAAMAGMDVEELLAGARFMDHRLKAAGPQGNEAYRLAALTCLWASRRGRASLVLLPGAWALTGMARWFCQLWAESLGTGAGVPALEEGRPSNWRLYLEGPQDQLIAFLEVAKFQHQVEVPQLFSQVAGLEDVEGRDLGDLQRARREVAAARLKQRGRPCLTLTLPEVNAFTMGQLIYLLETATVAAASLLGMNPVNRTEPEPWETVAPRGA